MTDPLPARAPERGVVAADEAPEVPAVTANLGRMALALLLFASVMVIVEVALHTQRFVRDRIKGDRAAAETPAGYRAAYPGRETDAVDLYRGEAAVGWGPTRYVPFIEWTRAPYSSRLVNIGPDGLRRTCFNSEDARAKHVWVFGGSTVWGSGAPDCETIPSQLSELLNKSGPHVVTNYGEGGFVSTQALIRFLTLVRNGQRPDAAVFYGGFNDVWTAVYVQPGGHEDEARMRRALEAGPWTRAVTGFRTAVDRDYLTLYYIRRLFGAATTRPQDTWVPPSQVDLGVEVPKAVDMYLENAKLARAIAAAYGFQVQQFWQPNLTNKHPLTDLEASWLKELPREVGAAFGSAARIIAERGAHHAIVDLQAMFKDDARPVFIDYAHLSGAGNRPVAARIAQEILAASNRP